MNFQARTESILSFKQSRMLKRVISQLQFAQELCQKDKSFENCIENALEIIEKCIAENGCITDGACAEAEKSLLPMSGAAKKYNVICCGHAHIDMNWLWRYDETVAITLDTFRTVLSLMREYPQFKFSQSQAAVYEIVEQYAPEMLAEIKEQFKRGNWELTASTWVEADRNMPSSESISRHLLYTKKYLSKILGAADDDFLVDFEPDTFGHNAFVPEILSKGGVKYYYHCRGDYGEHLYKWKSPQGGEVICYRDPYWYLGPATSNFGLGVVNFCEQYGLDTLLRVYGVGDHGGGPTRRDIEMITEMGTWPVFPQIRFGTYKEFYQIAEKSTRLNTVEGELNSIFTGCYTSQARIKQANRYGEAKLEESEKLCAIASKLTPLSYPRERFEKAWQKILFNQFHDILPGSGTIDTREHSMGIFSEAIAAADTQKTKAMRELGALADTSAFIVSEDLAASTSEGAGVGYGSGQGMAGILAPVGANAGIPFRIPQAERGRGINRIFHIFNPSPHERREVVELTMFDWDGNYRRLAVKDEKGQTLLHQLIDLTPQDYWQHKYVRLLVQVSLPPLGRTTIACTQNNNLQLEKLNYNSEPDFVREKPYEYVLENEYIRAEICSKTGALISIIDKAESKQLLKGDGGHFELIQEQPAENTAGTAWTVGRYRSVEKLLNNVTVRKGLNGELKNSITVTAFVNSSKIACTISLSKGSKMLDIFCDFDWRETGVPGQCTPQLRYVLPLSFATEQFLQNVPGGVIKRPAIAQDKPCQSFCAAELDNARSIMLITDSKYGMRGEAVNGGNAAISVSCLRSSTDPDPCPDFGRHQFRMGIALCSSSPVELMNTAYAFCHQPAFVSDFARKGTRPMTEQMLEISGAFLHAVKAAESSDDLIVRFVNPAETESEVVLSLFGKVKAVCFTDVHERQSSDDGIKTDGCKIYVKAPPKQMISLKILI